MSSPPCGRCSNESRARLAALVAAPGPRTYDGTLGALEAVTERLDRAMNVVLREREELAAFRRELEGPDAPPLAAWDVAYYAEKLRRARYDFDDEVLRPYFPLDRVVAGLFEIAHRLYG